MSEKEKETGEIEERDGFIAIPDGSLYYKKYDIQGKVGLPVVLLHGNRGTHRDFSSYIEVLTKAGCSVIAMDSRGHGASVMKMDRGCGYGGRCSPSVRSSENRKGSDPGIFRWRQYSFGVCRRSSRAGRKDHCSQCQCTAGRSDPSYAVYGEYPFPVCEDLREYKASGKIWKMV